MTGKKLKDLLGEENWKRLVRVYCWIIRHTCSVNKKKIVFSQFGGKGYGCNPKAICEEILKRNLDYELVWVLGKDEDPSKAGIPEQVRVTARARMLYDLLTAKVWINNIHFNVLIDHGLVKPRETIYLNTFHGGITLKNEGTDKHTYKADKELSHNQLMFRKDSEYVDYITCGCDAEVHVLEEFFYGKGQILKLGDARTDILVKGSVEIEKKVRKRYKIPKNAKIVIYAPTFRADQKIKWYNLDYEKVLDTLEEVYGCPWVMLIRLHPRLKGKTKKIVPKSPRFINAAGYTDMQELAVASDMMISDYSSVITDFMLTKKPAFMYVPDLEHYIEKRGMYFEVEDLPFLYARTTDELIQCITKFDSEVYQKKVDKFMKQIGYVADGKASERIVDFLIEKIES